MNRLTARNDDGVAYLPEWDGTVRMDEAQAETLENVVDQLAAYEDTGLTPDEIAALRAELDAFKADIEAGRLVRLKFKPHEFVSFLDEDNQVREHYRYLSSYLICGKPLHIVYHGSRPFEFYLAADGEISEDTPAARAALEGGQQ